MFSNFFRFKTSYLICVVALSLASCSNNNEDEGCATDLTNSEQDRVIEFVNEAVQYLKNTESIVAMAEFNKADGDFIDEELYIFVLQFDGLIVAHGADEDLVGTDQFDLQDINGTYIVQEIIESVNNDNDKGWSCYFWEDPLTDDIQQKYTYAYNVTSMNIIVAAGTYIVQ